MNTKYVKASAAFLAAALFMAGCSSPATSTSSKVSSTETSAASSEAASAPAKQTKSEPGGTQYTATIKIAGYDEPIVFTMDEGIAPETVENFVDLAQSGFYDGLTLHRIMEGFMIQGGDPKGDGTGGSSHQIEGEFESNGFDNSLKHVRGTVSMARAQDPDSASSQFFIVQEDTPSLDGQYAAFGTVTSGMDVVDDIAAKAEPTDDNGAIAKDQQPVIESITVVEEGK
ncbi:peptidylprolyl isomerase [Erysipelotrichaceae bacterium 51-3]